jgi:flavin reductase (DIM6/NTAB) family NADH-FMN oxidoreductase RutF
MNTELQKCMDTDKDNHIIYFGEIVDVYVLEDKGEQ